MKTLLIDLDQTLLASRKHRLRLGFIRAWLRESRKAGLGLWSGMKVLDRMKRALMAPPSDVPRKLNAERVFHAVAAATAWPESRARDFVLQSVPEVFRAQESHFSAIAEGAEFLDWAEPRYRLVLATNPVWPLEVVQMRMAWGGIRPDRFALITHAGLMHSCKPEVSYFQELLEMLKLRPEDAFMIGDSRSKDFNASLAGIPTFLIRPGEKHRKIAERVWVGNYRDLREVLNS